MLTSSGQAANLFAVLNVTSAGDNIVSCAAIYGGTVNLFAVTLKRMGIEVRFATQEMTDGEIEALIDENTRLVFGETIANPALDVFDIRALCRYRPSPRTCRWSWTTPSPRPFSAAPLNSARIS